MNRWVLGARPRTLSAAVVPVAVGAACAVGEPGTVWWRAPLALVVSVALQVGVNYANDYGDGARGADAQRIGPTRLVASGLASVEAVRRAALAAFSVAALVGLLLAVATTWWLLAVGAACLAAGWLYTGGPHPYGYLGLGEVFVFVFFGLVATAGTTYVVAERVTALSLVAAAGVGALACAILVVNNLRDIPTDRRVGKRTLAVRLGDRGTRWLYAALVVDGLTLFAVAGWWRPLALLSVPVGVAAAVAPVRTVLRGASGAELSGVLSDTARLQLVTGLALAGMLALGA